MSIFTNNNAASFPIVYVGIFNFGNDDINLSIPFLISQ